MSIIMSHYFTVYYTLLITIEHEFLTLALEVHFPPEFCSNPNPIHCNKAYKSIQVSSLIKVGSKLCRKVDIEGPS